ncbi:MAG: AAA family ATPase [Pseudomonadota bacterium]
MVESGTHRVLISGCSGGGKSTLIGALAAQGYPTFAEPGRRIVRKELESGGTALPWVAATRFAEHCARRAMVDYDAAPAGLSFFDRSFLDAAAGFERAAVAVPDWLAHALRQRRYAPVVYLTPPWPEIYESDAERQHDLKEAEIEYRHLTSFLPAQGYAVRLLPKLPVEGRVNWLLSDVQAAGLAA